MVISFLAKKKNESRHACIDNDKKEGHVIRRVSALRNKNQDKYDRAQLQKKWSGRPNASKHPQLEVKGFAKTLAATTPPPPRRSQIWRCEMYSGNMVDGDGRRERFLTLC